MQYNCRLYDYPTGQHVTIYKKTISRKEKDIIEILDSKNKIKKKTVKKETVKNEAAENGITNNNENILKETAERSEESIEHSKSVSLSRSKNSIYNIARSNEWQWFITLTFERNNTDASDYDMITCRLHTFMNNLQKRKCPDMKYIIVPELHDDKINYHFHGLLSGVDNLRFCFSGHFDKNDNPVYNILDWKYGWTTATQVKDSDKASSYITKYITKDTDLKLKNKRRYMCSRNIERAKPSYHILDEEEFLQTYSDRITWAKNIKVPAAHQSINYYELSY